jgi:hypothetical protein
MRLLRTPGYGAAHVRLDGMHDFNSLALHRPKMSTGMHENRSFGVLQLALRFGDAAVRSVFIVALRFAFAPRGALALLRSIERVVCDLRSELAEACTKLADERGEPPLDDDA